MDFNKVILENKQNIKNIIRLITKEDNEDLEQEVYLKIWKNSDKYTEKGSIKAGFPASQKHIFRLFKIRISQGFPKLYI